MCSWGDGSQESLLSGGGVIPVQILGMSNNKLDKEEGRRDCIPARGRWDVWPQGSVCVHNDPETLGHCVDSWEGKILEKDGIGEEVGSTNRWAVAVGEGAHRCQLDRPKESMVGRREPWTLPMSWP